MGRGERSKRPIVKTTDGGSTGAMSSVGNCSVKIDPGVPSLHIRVTQYGSQKRKLYALKLSRCSTWQVRRRAVVC